MCCIRAGLKQGIKWFTKLWKSWKSFCKFYLLIRLSYFHLFEKILNKKPVFQKLSSRTSENKKNFLNKNPVFCRQEIIYFTVLGDEAQWSYFLKVLGLRIFLTLMTKITPDVNNWGYFIKRRGYFIHGWFVGDMEYFNATFEQHKVI